MQLSETSSPMAGRFRVGEFLVDPSALRVHRDGEDARLEAKVMQVLVYLAHLLRPASRNALPALGFSAIQDFTRVATS